MESSVRPETLALGALIEATIERVVIDGSKQRSDGMLFLGNRHTAFPVLVVQDPVLEPVDKLVWMTILLQAQATGGYTAFPSYDYIRTTANIASKSTVARSIAVLRAARWLTLCARVRERSGRFRGNVFALHDEPLPLVDVLHLDTGYMQFLHDAHEECTRPGATCCEQAAGNPARRYSQWCRYLCQRPSGKLPHGGIRDAVERG